MEKLPEANSQSGHENKSSQDNETDENVLSESMISKLQYYEPTPELIEEAKKIIEMDQKTATEFWYKKYETDAKKNWDIFYRQNKDNFFKDRHYIDREFTELAEYKDKPDQFIFCELGCGVGNTIYPLIKSYPNMICYGFDFSPRAIAIIQEQEIVKENKDRVFVEVADLVKDPIPKDFPSPDLATLIFVLSAISPENHESVVSKIFDFMKPGSLLFLRDYGRYDMAQIKLASHKTAKLKDNFYVKGDGTRVYYFSEDEIKGIFEKAGFQALEVKMHYRVVENAKLELKMNRAWIQAKFVKKSKEQIQS